MKKHFFLIDDDADELDIFMEAIRKLELPAKCTYAQSAEQALDVLNYLSPDYIFIDINMPKVNGYECLAEIRSKPTLTDAYIVMYSNGVDDRAVEKAISMGASCCIRKTENIPDLVTALQHLMREGITPDHSHHA